MGGYNAESSQFTFQNQVATFNHRQLRRVDVVEPPPAFPVGSEWMVRIVTLQSLCCQSNAVSVSQVVTYPHFILILTARSQPHTFMSTPSHLHPHTLTSSQPQSLTQSHPHISHPHLYLFTYRHRSAQPAAAGPPCEAYVLLAGFLGPHCTPAGSNPPGPTPPAQNPSLHPGCHSDLSERLSAARGTRGEGNTSKQ